MYKTCPKCNLHKNISDFHKQKGGSFGRHSICKKCRSLARKSIKSVSLKIQNNSKKICVQCKKNQSADKFYKNRYSKDGLQSYCKICHIKKISLSKSALSSFAKTVLNKWKRKHKEFKVEINVEDVIKKWSEQKGLCHITRHKMTHITDLKQRTDNIWNMAILVDSNKEDKTVKYSDFNLVIHLIYTTKELYNMSNKGILELYKKLLDKKN